MARGKTKAKPGFKPGLISGCKLRTCPRCGAHTFVPINIDWRICSVCRRKEHG